MQHTNFDEIIITSLIRYGESDAIARVLTKEHGRLSLFCRNAFKPSKKRGSTVQVPARGRAAFKFRTQGLSNLTELDLGSYTSLLASNLRGFALAAYACELIEIFVPEQDPGPQLFDLLDDFLGLAAQTELKTSTIRAFELKLLGLSGLLAEPDPAIKVLVDAPLGVACDLGEALLKKTADNFVRHLKQHRQTPLKSLAFFKQITN